MVSINEIICETATKACTMATFVESIMAAFVPMCLTAVR
jgi:hypothetical protein